MGKNCFDLLRPARGTKYCSRQLGLKLASLVGIWAGVKVGMKADDRVRVMVLK